MRVFRTLEYRLTKSDSPASILRAVADDPERASFTISDVRIDAAETRDVIDIAAGVPRTYPAFDARFVIDNVDWSRVDRSMPPATRALGEDSHGAIKVSSGWWTTRRMNGLTVSIKLPVPPDDAPAPPEIPNAVRAVADRFGKVHQQSMNVVHDAEMNREELAWALNEKYDAALPKVAKTLPFPHLLVTPLEAESTYESANVGTYKEALKEVFGAMPRWYMYES